MQAGDVVSAGDAADVRGIGSIRDAGDVKGFLGSQEEWHLLGCWHVDCLLT